MTCVSERYVPEDHALRSLDKRRFFDAAHITCVDDVTDYIFSGLRPDAALDLFQYSLTPGFGRTVWYVNVWQFISSQSVDLRHTKFFLYKFIIAETTLRSPSNDNVLEIKRCVLQVVRLRGREEAIWTARGLARLRGLWHWHGTGCPKSCLLYVTNCIHKSIHWMKRRDPSYCTNNIQCLPSPHTVSSLLKQTIFCICRHCWEWPGENDIHLCLHLTPLPVRTPANMMNIL